MTRSVASTVRRQHHPRSAQVGPGDRVRPTSGAWIDLCRVDGNADFAPLYVLLDLGILEAYQTRSGTLHLQSSTDPATLALAADVQALLDEWGASGWPTDAEAAAALKGLTERRNALQPRSAA